MALAADAGKQMQNLRLGGYVERAGDFVAEQDLRLHGHGAGDRHALALPATELAGRAIHQFPLKPHPISQRGQVERSVSSAQTAYRLGD